MYPKKPDRQLSFLCPDLLDQLNPENYLLKLVKAIPWQVFEGVYFHSMLYLVAQVNLFV